MEEERPRFLRLRPLEFDLGDLLVQIVAVALGVIAGLAVNAWQDGVHDRVVLRRDLSYLAVEIQDNREQLLGQQPLHRRAGETLDALVASGQRRGGVVTFWEFATTLQQAMPHGYGEFLPETTAWQIAQRDGLTLMPYGDRAELTKLYDVQTRVVELQQAFVDSLFAGARDAGGNFFLATIASSARAHDVVAQEEHLSTDYAKAIDHLRARGYPAGGNP